MQLGVFAHGWRMCVLFFYCEQNFFWFLPICSQSRQPTVGEQGIKWKNQSKGVGNMYVIKNALRCIGRSKGRIF